MVKLFRAIRYSETVKDLMQEARRICLKNGTGYIGVTHVLLAIDSCNNSVIPYSLSKEQKSELIDEIKGDDLFGEDDCVPITVELETILQNLRFYKNTTSERYVQPEHLLLGILFKDEFNRKKYIQILQENGYKINLANKLKIYRRALFSMY